MKYPLLAFLALALVLAGCSPKSPFADSFQAQGNQETLTDSLLQRDTIAMLKAFEGRPPVIVEKRVIQNPDQNKIWIEAWTIERIDAHVVYTITFVPSPDGGTDIKISTPPKQQE